MFKALIALSCVCLSTTAVAAGDLPAGCQIASQATGPSAQAPAPPVFPPVQLQVRTPLAPTVLRSGAHAYLLYELHLQNFSTAPMALHGIEVRDAAHPGAPPLAVLDTAQLLARLRQATIGDDPADGSLARLGAGQSVVAYLCLAFDAKSAVPAKLRHRVLLDNGFADGPAIGTRTTPLAVLDRPLTGTDWTPANNPALASHHRMGLWVVDGHAQISRRYAIDWKKFDGAGQAFRGDPKDVHAYYAYGQQVLAVANGTVVAARDGLPDNVPKTPAGFETAVPITLDTVGGNQLIIDLGRGQFAAYFHLQPGSVQLKPGQRVRRGQPIARIGNSGDARWPHLHFQLSDAPDAMASEGLPFVFDHYRSRAADADWETREREYPMGDVVVDFGQAD